MSLRKTPWMVVTLLFVAFTLGACGNTLRRSSANDLPAPQNLLEDDQVTFDEPLPGTTKIDEPDPIELNVLFSNGFEDDLAMGWNKVRDDGLAPLGDLASIVSASSLSEGGIEGASVLKTFTDDQDNSTGTDPNSGASASVLVNFDQPENVIFVQAHFLLKEGFTCTLAQGEGEYDDYKSIIKFSKNEASENLLSISLDGLCRPYVWNSIAAEAYTASDVFLTAGDNAQWHKFKFMGKVSPTEGEVTVWLDGVQIIHKTGLNTGNTDFSRFIFGIGWQGKKDKSHTLYVDQVVIHNQDFTL